MVCKHMQTLHILGRQVSSTNKRLGCSFVLSAGRRSTDERVITLPLVAWSSGLILSRLQSQLCCLHVTRLQVKVSYISLRFCNIVCASELKHNAVTVGGTYIHVHARSAGQSEL